MLCYNVQNEGRLCWIWFWIKLRKWNHTDLKIYNSTWTEPDVKSWFGWPQCDTIQYCWWYSGSNTHISNTWKCLDSCNSICAGGIKECEHHTPRITLLMQDIQNREPSTADVSQQDGGDKLTYIIRQKIFVCLSVSTMANKNKDRSSKLWQYFGKDLEMCCIK